MRKKPVESKLVQVKGKDPMYIKIGELARRAGITVRTLHHYDHINLLSPSFRSENGFRLYSQDDVSRLQRIQALKQFGCSLTEVRSFLDEPQGSITDIISKQITFLTQRIEKAQDLRDRLSRLNEQILRGYDTKLPDWLTLLEVMAMYKKRFSRQELDILRKNKLAGNLDRKWRKLVTDVQELINLKIPVSDEKAQKCARQWIELVIKLSGNDPALAVKLKMFHQEEPKARILTGITKEIGDFMRQAIEFAGKNTNQIQNVQTAGLPKPTAFRVAQFRALHQILEKPLIFEDPYAAKILGGLPEGDLSRFNEPLYRGLRTSIVIRSRLTEDEWKKSYDKGLRQYVILGAGLDTFAFRFGHLEGIKIFEVDLPATQAWKRQCLQSAGMVPPSSLSFVPSDFDTTSLGQNLNQAGFLASSPAFFSWLGVTMYIDKTSISNTLLFIASCAPGSTVILDYCVDPAQLSVRELKGFEIISKRVRDQGEPWKTFFAADTLAKMLHSLGFTKIEDFGPDILNERYLSNRNDGLRKSGVARIMRAEI